MSSAVAKVSSEGAQNCTKGNGNGEDDPEGPMLALSFKSWKKQKQLLKFIKNKNQAEWTAGAKQ